MHDISFQGASLTLKGPRGIGTVTLRDLSDDGSPISFGSINPIRTSKTMHGIMLAWHAQTQPQFSISPIPGSASDVSLRALLLSAQVRDDREVVPLIQVLLSKAVLKIPSQTGTDGVVKGGVFTFTNGFLVGGAAAIGSTGEGRQVTGQYQFMWERVESPRSL